MKIIFTKGPATPGRGLIMKRKKITPEMQTSCITTIHACYPSLSTSNKKIADFILTVPQDVIYLSITEFAEKAGVSEATISRFCRLLGLKGFQELKMVLAQEISTFDRSGRNEILGVKPDAVVEPVAQHALRVTENTIQYLNETDIRKAVDLVLGARSIVFLGVGTSGSIAYEGMLEFMRIGLNCVYHADTHAQTMHTALLGEQDVVVALSHSGSTKDVLTSAQIAKEVGAKLICITGSYRTPLSRLADVNLIASKGEPTIVSSFLPAIGQLIALECIFTGCMEKLGPAAQNNINRTAQTILSRIY